MKKKNDALLEKFATMDRHLHAAKEDLKTMKAFIKTFEDAKQNLNLLQDAYMKGDWMNDRETLFEKFPNEVFESAGEDAVWDTLQEFYYLKIKLMKIFADEVYRAIPDYYHGILES